MNSACSAWLPPEREHLRVSDFYRTQERGGCDAHAAQLNVLREKRLFSVRSISDRAGETRSAFGEDRS